MRSYPWLAPTILSLSAISVFLAIPAPVTALNVSVDYRFDDSNFFDPGTSDGLAARSSLEAAADRWSAIITSSLTEVTPDDFTDWRIAFNHPANGAFVEFSTADSAGVDSLAPYVGAATYYDGSFTLNADTWVLFAGARDLPGYGYGGTGHGSNYTATATALGGPIKRGVGGPASDLPRWGGSISFDTSRSNWHLDPSTAPAVSSIDFYSVALHEMAHALGLNIDIYDFNNLVSGNRYSGANAVDALNLDNNSSITTIQLVDINTAPDNTDNLHWADDIHQSYPFNGDGSDLNTVGVDPNALQDLLMDALFDITVGSTRFEVTNADAAAMEDIGWTILPAGSPVPEPSRPLLITLAAAGIVFRRRRP